MFFLQGDLDFPPIEGWDLRPAPLNLGIAVRLLPSKEYNSGDAVRPPRLEHNISAHLLSSLGTQSHAVRKLKLAHGERLHGEVPVGVPDNGPVQVLADIQHQLPDVSEDASRSFQMAA